MAGLCSALASAGTGADCAACHPAEVKLHDRTRMAHAMVPAGNSAFGENLSDRPLQERGNGYQLFYRKSVFGNVLVTAKRGNTEAEGVIEWVLGAGAQGQTPLVRTADRTLESHVSYFPQARQYGITIGQEGGVSHDPEAALG
ncbi:MAG: hypothetical protein M3Y72_24920, partial [Acidobacteriota bacterium]|nr:hypothetical protein [Acidobacteriota bacterium]